MSTIIIYHAHCSDGTVAAAVAFDALTRGGHKPELFAAKYGDAPPDVTGKHVVIVDFSYPRNTLLGMRDAAADLVVLDHHKTAQADLDGLDFCMFDMNRSGAGLAWDYFHRDEPRPWLVNAVEDRDLWRFAIPDTADVFAAFSMDQEQLVDAALKVEAAAMMLNADETDRKIMASEGKLLNTQFKGIVANICEQAYRVELLGVEMMAVNAPGKFASEGGNYLVLKYGMPALVWYSDGKELKIMLRSADELADVSDIATAFGGGGHRNAAGFRAGLRFFDEVGAEHVKPEVEEGHELEAAGVPGVQVWDVSQGADMPGA